MATALLAAWVQVNIDRSVQLFERLPSSRGCQHLDPLNDQAVEKRRNKENVANMDVSVAEDDVELTLAGLALFMKTGRKAGCRYVG